MKQEEFKENDILRDYLIKEESEKAPEGFTSRVMENIYLQPAILRRESRFIRYRIPLITIAVTVVLIAATILFAGNSGSIVPVPSYIPGSLLSLMNLNLNFDLVPELTVPGWLPWILVSVLLLFVFDRALDAVFRREKRA